MLGGFSQVGPHIAALLYSTRVIFLTYYLKRCQMLHVINVCLSVCCLHFASGWGFVLVYRLDLPASVGWCCGPQLLATTSQEFPIGTVTSSSASIRIVLHCRLELKLQTTRRSSDPGGLLCLSLRCVCPAGVKRQQEPPDPAVPR